MILYIGLNEGISLGDEVSGFCIFDKNLFIVIKLNISYHEFQ